jgi:hypothetical protein
MPVGDFVRFSTRKEGNWKSAGIRFEKLIAEFNANSPMVVIRHNGGPDGTTDVSRDGQPAGTWPTALLVAAPTPVSNPPPPMVPDAI